MELLGILVVVVIVIYLYNLLLQLISKSSGKNFKFRGVSRTVVKTTDFDESVAALKQTKQDLKYFVNKFRLSENQQIIYKFETLLKDDNSSFIYNYSNFEKLMIKYQKFNKRISDLEERGKNDKTNGIFRPYTTEEDTEYLRRFILPNLSHELSDYSNLFKIEDSIQIMEFICGPLDNQKSKIFEFLNILGLKNFAIFCQVIDELTEMYIKNKVTKEDINNIKLIILYHKGIIDMKI